MQLSLRTPVLAAIAALLVMGASREAQAITYGNVMEYQPTSGFNGQVYNASGFDKLVVVVTGEHNFPNNAGGNINSVTYGGVNLVQAVNRDPIGPNPSNNATAADIWYLDNPAASGALNASVNGNGNNYVYTVFGLTGTAPGVGATAISNPNLKSVDLVALGSDSLVVASHGMGGDGNTADTQNVNAVGPALEISDIKIPRSWSGQVVSVTNNVGAGLATYSFVGGNVAGTVTIAAEFQSAAPSVPEPATASLALLGLGGIMMRRRRID